MPKKVVGRKLFILQLCLAIFLLILIEGCAEQASNTSDDSVSLSGNAVTEISRACKYPNGDFCDEICCISDAGCNGNPAYNECDLKTGNWKGEIYSDSGCKAKCDIVQDSNSKVQMDGQKTDSDKNKKETEANISNACAETWKCVDEKYRAHLNSDCSINEMEYCSYKCIDGICADFPSCGANSTKCFGNELKKCDEKGKSWVLQETCEYDCDDGVCIEEPVTRIQDEESSNASQQNDCSNCINIYNLHYDAAGNDCQNLNDEYIIFSNNCTYSCDLDSWNVSDATYKSYIFPSFSLSSGSMLNFSTGVGTDTINHLYWNSPYTPCRAIWNNDADTLYLFNKNKELILTYAYP